MTTVYSIFRAALLSFVITGFSVLGGCKPAASALPDQGNARQAGESATQSVMIDSVNYMHERGVKYTVYDLSGGGHQAIGGAIVDMLGTGGEKGCCLALPKAWRPGLKVRLQWEEADYQRIYPQQYSRDLEIPRYAQPADLYVVFYPSHVVELLVSAVEPGHPDWPGKVKATPWEHCLAQHERKVCKAALPKQFDTKSSQGFCTYLKEEGDVESQGLCEFAMYECMRDYEDEAFCKNILFGARRK